MTEAENKSNQDRIWPVLCHGLAILGFVIPFGNVLGPLVLWLALRKENPEVDREGRESLNFQISMTIYSLVALVLIFLVIGIFLLVALGVVDLILVIIATIKTANGESYQYPFNLRLIKG